MGNEVCRVADGPMSLSGASGGLEESLGRFLTQAVSSSSGASRLTAGMGLKFETASAGPLSARSASLPCSRADSFPAELPEDWSPRAARAWSSRIVSSWLAFSDCPTVSGHARCRCTR